MVREGRVQTHGWVGVEQSETVGSDDAHTVAARSLDQRLLQLFAFCADLGKAGSDDDDRFHATHRAVIDYAKQYVWRDSNDGQIRRFR